MPPDTKRITGPETSTPYRAFSVKSTKTFENLRKELLNNDKVRKDKRKLNESREIFGRTGVVSQAKGSAYIEMGNTKVIASVFEPREIPKQTEFSYQGELFVEFKYAPFACDTRCPLVPGNEEKELAASVKRALEPAVLRHLFENFQIDIFVYVLENDGACLASAINAAGLALADAEVPMYDILCANTIGINGSDIFVDPTISEEQFCTKYIEDTGDADHGLAVMATLPVMDQIAEFWQHGALSLEKLTQITDTFKSLSEELYPKLQAILIDRLDKFLMEKKTNLKENGEK